MAIYRTDQKTKWPTRRSRCSCDLADRPECALARSEIKQGLLFSPAFPVLYGCLSVWLSAPAKRPHECPSLSPKDPGDLTRSLAEPLPSNLPSTYTESSTKVKVHLNLLTISREETASVHGDETRTKYGSPQQQQWLVILSALSVPPDTRHDTTNRTRASGFCVDLSRPRWNRRCGRNQHPQDTEKHIRPDGRSLQIL